MRYKPIRKGNAKVGQGQPECFHGDWVSAIPLRGQRSLTRRSICHAASGGSQSRKRCQEKKDESEEGVKMFKHNLRSGRKALSDLRGGLLAADSVTITGFSSYSPHPPPLVVHEEEIIAYIYTAASRETGCLHPCRQGHRKE